MSKVVKLHPVTVPLDLTRDREDRLRTLRYNFGLGTGWKRLLAILGALVVIGLD